MQIHWRAVALSAGILSVGQVMAGEFLKKAAPVASSSAAEGSWCSDSKNWLRLYSDPEAKYINEFRLTGRFQYQMAWVDARQEEFRGSHGSESEWRRFRLGAQAKVFKDFKVVNNWDIGGLSTLGVYNPNFPGWEDREGVGNMLEMYVEWTKGNYGVRVGKFLPGISAEYRQSTATMPNIEYAALVNQLRPQSFGSNFGVELSQGCAKGSLWGAKLTFVGTQTEGRYGETPVWDSDATMIVGEISREVDGALMEKGRVYLDYGHNFTDMSDVRAVNGREYVGTGAQDIVSLSYEGKQGKWGLLADALAGFNPRDLNGDKAGSHVYGVVVTPTYRLAPHWELMSRVEWSTGENSVLLNPRYARLVQTGGGYVDGLTAGTVGVSYYLCPENPGLAKIMAEVGYLGSHGGSSAGRMKDGMDGWQYMLAVRMNF